MNARDTMSYLTKRLRRDRNAAARGTVYLAGCVTALVSFAVLMPSLEYQHVRAVQEARWDVWVSGPMSDEYVRELAALPGVDGVAPALALSIDGVSGPRTTREQRLAHGMVMAVAYRDPNDLDSGPYPSSLLLSGRPPRTGEWACDWSVARRLGLRVGDTVAGRAVMASGEVPLEGRLAGVYGPTGALMGTVAMPASEELARLVSRDGGSRWSDAYLDCSDQESVAKLVSEGASDRLLILPRTSLEREGRSRLLREVGPFLRNAATWVAAVGFLALALWQQSSRFAARRGEYAILTALGMPRASLVCLDAAEQAARLGLVSLVGIAGAVWVVQTLNGMYVPTGAIAGAVGVVIATVALTLLAGALSLARLLRKHSLADVLSSERPG